jgi:sugar/nucleoside kinase (ribokinase family)
MISLKSDADFDVTGIGSPLVDYIVDADDALIEGLALTKGSMTLIDEEGSRRIRTLLNGKKVVKVPGGSAANTLAGIALLGGTSAFMGSIGDDTDGKFYISESERSGIRSFLRTHDAMTGHAITFITNDGERTFATHLGAAIHLCAADVDHAIVSRSKVFHIEGYLLEGPNQREAVRDAIQTARRDGVLVSLDAADPGVVTRNKIYFDEYVRMSDIVFFNEEEATAYTGLSGKNAALDIAKKVKIAVVKLGAHGSVVASEGSAIMIKGFPADVVNTNGAGDNYAAGFLFGLTGGKTLEECGTIASFIASRVVEEQGARLTSRPDIDNIT